MTQHNILIYIEPRTDMDHPVARGPWLGFALELLTSMGLSPAANPGRVRIACNAWIGSMAANLNVPEECTITIDEQLLLAPFGGNAGLHRHATFLETAADKPANEAVGQVIKDALDGFEPDLIVTFVAEPALSYACPHALLLHHEIGGFSRPPYPQTFRLDPCGLIADSWPYRARGALTALAPNEASTRFMERLRSHFLDELVEPHSPFKAKLAAMKQRAGKLWLMPLGPPLFNYHYPVPESPVNFMTQFDMIQWLMPQVPAGQAVLLIEHPQMPFLTEDQIAAIDARWPNAVFLPEAGEIGASSQYIVPYVDGVITVNSSVGYQAALYGKELICLGGRSFLSPLADGFDAGYMADGNGRKDSAQVDAVLHHLFTHYFVPGAMFRDPGFITELMDRCRRRYPDRAGALDFYDRIDSDDKILDALIAACTPAPPQTLYPLSRKMPASQLALVRKYDRQYLWPSGKGD